MISEINNRAGYKKVFTAATLIKAQLQEQEGSFEKATKNYELAVNADRKYYTIDYYSRFLLERKNWQTAKTLLQQKIELPRAKCPLRTPCLPGTNSYRWIQ